MLFNSEKGHHVLAHLPSLHKALLSLEGQLSSLNDAGRRDRCSL